MAGIIVANNISFSYSKKKSLIHELSFSLNAGHLYHVKGENGCGKTSLLKLIAGYISPQAGTIKIFEHECHTQAAIRQRWFMEANPYLYNYLTVYENVLFACDVNMGSLEQVLETLKSLSMEKYLDELYGTLSAGQKRKVWIALTAYSHTRKIVLIDEPLSDVDPDGVSEILKLLEILLNHQITVIIVSHIYEERLRLLKNYNVITMSS